jgi:hypothetical protein
MNYKASDFFLDVVDFFAILVPGLILTYLAAHVVSSQSLKGLPVLQETWQQVLAFLVVAYSAGQLIYAAGSWFLDPIYDNSYRNYREGVRGAELRAAVENRLRLYFGGRVLTGTTASVMAVLTLRAPTAWGEVQRLDADSKFFRGLTIVLLVGPYSYIASRFPGWSYLVLSLVLLLGSLVVFLATDNKNPKTAEASPPRQPPIWAKWPILAHMRWKRVPAVVFAAAAFVALLGTGWVLGSWPLAVGYFVLTLASFLRFSQQRWQRNEGAYELFIALEAPNDLGPKNVATLGHDS